MTTCECEHPVYSTFKITTECLIIIPCITWCIIKYEANNFDLNWLYIITDRLKQVIYEHMIATKFKWAEQN